MIACLAAAATLAAALPAGAALAAPPPPRHLAGRGVYYLDTRVGCPLGGVGARGPNACLRVALDDGDTTADVDQAAHRIVLRNARSYESKTVIGDVVIVGYARAPSNERVPVAVHLLVQKKGDDFDAKPHAHVPIKERTHDVEIDGYDVVLAGAEETVALTAATAREAIVEPGVAARLASQFVQVKDNLAGARPAGGPIADVTVAVGLGKAAKSVARAQLIVSAPANAATVAALMTGGAWEVRFETLSRLVPKDVVRRDLFLYGLEDLPLFADVKKNGLAKGKAIVFTMRDGRGRLAYGADSVDLPDAADHARAFLELSFLGAILAHQATGALAASH